MSAATFGCFEDPWRTPDDAVTAAMRQQLRAMYRWIDNAPPGAANIEIVCRPKSPAPVVAKHLEAAAAELQDSIHARREEEISLKNDWLEAHGFPRIFDPIAFHGAGMSSFGEHWIDGRRGQS